VFENSSGRLILILILVLFLDFLRKRRRKTTVPGFFKHALRERLESWALIVQRLRQVGASRSC
jgi:hypothetical protein